jgi:small subunit ribosomal protein S21
LKRLTCRNTALAPGELGPAKLCFRAGFARTKEEGFPLQVLVRDNNIDQALRVLKKKMQREGVFREMKQRKSYEKPSERKNREKYEAIRRARKLARKKAMRDGLIPDTRKKKLDDKRPGRPGAGGGAAAGAGGDRGGMGTPRPPRF